MKSLRSAHSAVVCGALLISTLAFAKSPEGSFQKSFTVNGPVNLEVFTHSGDITVRPGPAGTVSVSGKIYTGNGWIFGARTAAISEVEKNPPVQQNGNTIHIKYAEQKNISVNYEITVPADTKVHTHSNSGDQTIEGIRQSVAIESDSGDMRLRDISGEVHLRTGSGDVDGRQIAGSIHAETGSGDIRLDESGSGEIRVRTGSGDIGVQGANGSLYADSGNGDITIAGNIAGPWSIHTGSGDVRVSLPSQAAFDLDASTSSGDLNVGHAVATAVQGTDRDEHVFVGKVGDGGPSLVVRTGSGDVQIH